METRHKKIDFRDLSDFQLPRFFKNRHNITAQTLFPVKIVDEEPARHCFKVHYIVYGVNYDEWKDKTKIEVLGNHESSTEETELTASYLTLIKHYSLFKDLGVKIKQALSCNRKTSPNAKITMSFDILYQ